MNKSGFFSSIKNRFKKNYQEGPIPKLISMVYFWIIRYKLKKLFKPQNVPAVARNFTKENGRSWVILNYHRIADPETHLLPINEFSYVRPETFEMHCSVLSKECNVISLSELIQKYLSQDKNPPHGTIVLNINNGHLDSYLKGIKPLVDYKIPASWVFPLYYLGSPYLLIEDQIATWTQLMQHHSARLPGLKGLEDFEWQAIEKVLDKGVPTPQIVKLLFGFILVRNPSQRHRLMSQLKEHLEKLPTGLPEYSDFMSLNDLFTLKESGFDLIPGIFNYTILTELSKDAIFQEIRTSKEIFNKYDFPWYNVVGLPFNYYNDETLENLSDAGVLWCLGGEFPPSLNEQKQATKVLKRTKINQHNAFSRDFFLSKIWGLT